MEKACRFQLKHLGKWPDNLGKHQELVFHLHNNSICTGNTQTEITLCGWTVNQIRSTILKGAERQKKKILLIYQCKKVNSFPFQTRDLNIASGLPCLRTHIGIDDECNRAWLSISCNKLYTSAGFLKSIFRPWE